MINDKSMHGSGFIYIQGEFHQILETNSEKPSQKHRGNKKDDPCLVAESSY